MIFGAIIALLDDLAKLGASPAVQQFALKWASDLMGVSQSTLEAAIKSAKDAPPPKIGDTPK